jgi:uncharacterized protein
MQNPVPFFTHSLTALSKLLDKAEAYGEAKRVKPEVFPTCALSRTCSPWRAKS